MENNNINAKFRSLVNDENVLNTFVSLYERWQDEKKYEDFKEYAKVMGNSTSGVLGEITGVKGTKRPFGIKFIAPNNNKFHLFIKTNGMSAWLCLKAVA